MRGAYSPSLPYIASDGFTHTAQALSLSGDHFLPTGADDRIGASGAVWDKRVMRRARDVQPGMLVWALDGEAPTTCPCAVLMIRISSRYKSAGSKSSTGRMALLINAVTTLL